MAKHYRRAEEAKGLVPQHRDLAVLTRLVRNRIMTGLHIAYLAGGQDYYRKRLRLLYEHGYIDKIQNPIRDFSHTGSTSHIYKIGERGRTLLQEYDELLSPFIMRQLRWATITPEPTQFPHRLAQVETMALIEAACNATKGIIEFIPCENIIDTEMPEDIRTGPRPLTSNITLSYLNHHGDPTDRVVSITPDDLFALRIHHPDGPKTSFFLLEEDRKMDIYKSNLEQSSLYRKYLTYSAIESIDGFHSWIGIRKPRIITVMSQHQKIWNTLQKLGKKLKHKDGYKASRFLFLGKDTLPDTPHERLNTALDLFTTPLTTAAGKETYLIDQEYLKAVNLV